MVVTSPITGAAIIGGELILSLPTGQIINCGLVQGPPGLKGEPGAPGPRRQAGLDGNTLYHGQGFPQSDLGRDGDLLDDRTGCCGLWSQDQRSMG